MAAVNVTIKYVGILHEAVREGMPIANMMKHTGSYIDAPVMTEGYTNDGNTGDKKSYGPSIYATNVYSKVSFEGLDPMAHTPAKFAHFEQARHAAIEAKKKGQANAGVTFEVEGHKEVLYWEQMCKAMVDNGFFSKVGTKTFGVDA